ncbi:hypothetical protein BDY17DRAFT_265048 [Neohortaea acidophila]|uniref:DUF7053 domain-containing protein n=1 Tax=Neohortaea acidophila TaxID=245834 RepID=A0A6A6PS13_9PEZI|nr:uncharacterized protein BDY17DRAFT_265048 [Neohortaea acidophila]KAF2482890.1 hypothetical protein BDY17DRAFT_265048 [Neohortaea acidophila]
MGRHVFYTKITPLPANIPRLLALDLLHSHDEFIRLNPLVINVRPIDAPRNAEGDEYFSNWYEITEIMKVTGVKVRYDFKGCFHNQSWGMQSHVFAPLGIEFRNKYRIGGNQPGEPKEDRELGVDTPVEGLYLREDISFTCNTLMASFVRKEMQEASRVMIDRMRRKAELLDEGKLLAMFQNGELKTSKPGQGAAATPLPPPEPISDGEYSSSLSSRNSYATMNQQPPPDQQRRLSDKQGQGHYGVTPIELPGEYYHPQQQSGQANPQQQPLAFRYELPGDNSLYPPDLKPRPPPNATHPAYQTRSSPLSSPRLSSAGSASTNPSARSSYQAYNPEQAQQQQQQQQSQQQPQQQQNPTGTPRVTSHQSIPEEPGAAAPSSPSSGQHPQIQRNASSGDENYYHNYSRLRPPQPAAPPEPDHQRLSTLSISNPSMGRSTSNSSSYYGDEAGTMSTQQSSGQQSVVATCPVCKTFQGDEPAVGHHVEVTHGLT